MSEDFFKIVSNGTVEEVQKAIDEGANVNNPDSERFSPLMLAAESNQNPEVIEVLINAGADVNYSIEGFTPLIVAACANPNPEVIMTFIKAGSQLLDSCFDELTAVLHIAAPNNPNPNVFLYLIKSGADINDCNNDDGVTPLMEAASLNQNPEVISTLLKSGADRTLRDKAGKTAFDYAKDNEKIKGTAVYWELNDAQFK